MISTEEISCKVYELLNNSKVKYIISGEVGYQRVDYSKEDVIIVPHAVDGCQSIRFGEIKVNIHVPDMVDNSANNPIYRTNFPRLIEIRREVIKVLKNYYVDGYNWQIGLLNPPIPEVDHKEHFVSLSLELTILNKM